MAANKYVALVAGKLKEVFGSTVGTANAIPAGDATGRLDISWMPVGIGPETITVVASEALAAGAFVNVYLNGAVLNVRNADNTTNTKKAIGFVLTAVASAGSASVYEISQTNTAMTGLTIGADYFLSTVGGVTVTPPTVSASIVQFLGQATSATSLVFDHITTIEIA